MSKRTMKAFDEMCLTPVEDLAPEAIREIRRRENASQAVFALPQRDDGLLRAWFARGRDPFAVGDTASEGDDECILGFMYGVFP